MVTTDGMLSPCSLCLLYRRRMIATTVREYNRRNGFFCATANIFPNAENFERNSRHIARAPRATCEQRHAGADRPRPPGLLPRTRRHPAALARAHIDLLAGFQGDRFFRDPGRLRTARAGAPRVGDRLWRIWGAGASPRLGKTAHSHICRSPAVRPCSKTVRPRKQAAPSSPPRARPRRPSLYCTYAGRFLFKHTFPRLRRIKSGASRHRATRR